MTAATDLVQRKADTLQNLLDTNRKQIEAALPKHLTADRLLNIAVTEARRNPALLECTQASFLGAIIQTAQLGLEPGGTLGHAYLVPFKNNRNGTTEVQFIIGYKGMMSLSYRSPLISHVIARAVYDGDEFSFQYGTDENIVHKPDMEANGQKITHVYAIAFLRNGGRVFDVMEHKEIEAARKRSKAADSGPWDTDYESMAKKSIVRRMFKYCPVSIEMQQAVGLDEAAERGEQNNGDFIETTGTMVPETKASKLNSMLNDEPPPAATKPTIVVPKEEPKREMSRIELGKAINIAAKKIGVNAQDYCHALFECDTKDITIVQMHQMLTSLERDFQEKA